MADAVGLEFAECFVLAVFPRSSLFRVRTILLNLFLTCPVWFQDFDATSTGADLTEDELQALYRWIDTIPLTRPKRSIARDFADGGVMEYHAVVYKSLGLHLDHFLVFS